MENPVRMLYQLVFGQENKNNFGISMEEFDRGNFSYVDGIRAKTLNRGLRSNAQVSSSRNLPLTTARAQGTQGGGSFT